MRKRRDRLLGNVGGKTIYKLLGGALRGANNLVKITIPKSIISFDNGVFGGAPNLTTVTLNVSKDLATSLPEVGGGLMDGCNPNIKIYVPKNKYSIMKTDYHWRLHAKYLFSQN